MNLTPQAEEEGYDWCELAMGAGVVEVIIENDGRCAASAIDVAALAFIDARLFAHGMNRSDAALAKRVEAVDAMGEPVLELADDAWKFARTLADSDLTQKSFADFRLRDYYDPDDLPEAIQAVKSRVASRSEVPEHEQPMSPKTPRNTKAKLPGKSERRMK